MYIKAQPVDVLLSTSDSLMKKSLHIGQLISVCQSLWSVLTLNVFRNSAIQALPFVALALLLADSSMSMCTIVALFHIVSTWLPHVTIAPLHILQGCQRASINNWFRQWILNMFCSCKKLYFSVSFYMLMAERLWCAHLVLVVDSVSCSSHGRSTCAWTITSGTLLDHFYFVDLLSLMFVRNCGTVVHSQSHYCDVCNFPGRWVLCSHISSQ